MLAKLLNRDDVCGRLIRDFVSLEAKIDVALIFYFTTTAHHQPFQDLVVESVGVNDKIRILEKLPYKKQYRCLRALPLVRKISTGKKRRGSSGLRLRPRAETSKHQLG